MSTARTGSSANRRRIGRSAMVLEARNTFATPVTAIDAGRAVTAATSSAHASVAAAARPTARRGTRRSGHATMCMALAASVMAPERLG